MEARPLTCDLNKVWDEFCRTSPDAWFWHTTDWLAYNNAYHRGLRPRPLNFLCYRESKVVAIIPLVLTHHEEGAYHWKAFTMSGLPLPAPALAAGLSPTERDDVIDFIFAAIDDIAEELGVSYSRFQIDPLRPAALNARYAPYNFMLRNGFIDCSINTQIIDLRLPRTELRHGLRRNHLRSIEKGREIFQTHIHAGSSLTNEKFEEYARMHARAAGRITRPQATFDLMRKWIQSGQGFVVEALTKEGVPAGFELYLTHKGACYGLSACNEPEYKHLPIRHLIEWEAMLWMRSHGIEFYDIGAQHFGTLPHDFPEKKNQDISHFKYGFGGATAPFFLAERFYSAEHWRYEQASRSKRFEARYLWTTTPRSADGRTLLELLDRPQKPATEPQQTKYVSLPPEYLRLAEAVVAEHPKNAKQCLEGNLKALHFLVGLVLRGPGKGKDPLLLRRAIEGALAPQGARR